MTRKYRKGGVGAMMDEYERAVAELARVIEGIDDAAFDRLRDPRTEDDACRSIRTVVHHVVRAGYGYAAGIRTALGVQSSRPEVPQPSRANSLDQLRAMLAFTEETLEGRWEMPDEQIMAVKIETPWRVTYDLEQMLEHAIVHVLRHRRQIERFLSEPQFQKTV